MPTRSSSTPCATSSISRGTTSAAGTCATPTASWSSTKRAKRRASTRSSGACARPPWSRARRRRNSSARKNNPRSAVRVERAVAELPDAIVPGRHGFVLLLNQPARLVVEVLRFERGAIRVDGDVLRALAFDEDGVRLRFRRVAGLHLHPGAVQLAARAGAQVGLAAQRAHARRQLLDEL